jgi:hypothetical protein
MARSAHMPGDDRGGDRPDEATIAIGRRQSGSQVVSVRLPTDLAVALNRRADAQGMKLSEVVRAAVEQYLHQGTATAQITLSMTLSAHLRGITVLWPTGTESTNLVVSEQLDTLTYIPYLSSNSPSAGAFEA